MKKFFVIALACSILNACSSNADQKQTNNLPDPLTADMDSSVKPSEDFFQYANGFWLKNNPIPAEESQWGIGNVVNLENQKRLREISEDAAKQNAAKGTTSQKIGDFWLVAMDSITIETQGTKYLQPYLNKIDSISDISSLMNVMAQLNTLGVSAFFSDYVTQDSKQSDIMSYYLFQGGLGLPDREYYFSTDTATVNIRKAYQEYLQKMLRLSGTDSLAATQASDNIFEMEKMLAIASRKREDLRDPYANYHKTAIKDLSKLCPAIDWQIYLSGIGVKNIDSVIVGQPEFFQALNNVLKTTPVKTWKNYLRFQLLDGYAVALPDAYGLASFNFNKLLSGASERRPRWKRVIYSEENAIGELLGQLYVKKFFNKTSKERYEEMAEDIRNAYKERIKNISWMSDSTKQKAIVKLAAVKKKIGYPDKWKDFSGMEITKESYVQNLINANKWWHHFKINKLGKPVDRDEWGMYPQTYNAYYDPSNNEIVFPAAAFIVPGYMDDQLDDALMWGYVGASYIGHEITHGFDDEGRQFDDKGNLKNWWSPKDSAEFKKRAQLMVNQFDEIEPLPGLHVNGKASLGENIADLGGLEIAVEAFKKTKVYKNNDTIAGLFPMQRFFLGYALSWMYQQRDESLRTQLMTDPHSPAKYRVNTPFEDVNEFYSAFNIKPGDKMYRPDSLRVKIW